MPKLTRRLAGAARKRFQSFRERLVLIRRKMLTPAQLAAARREKELWRHITENLRELEGSRWAALKRQVLFLKGNPKKKSRQISRPGIKALF